MCVFVTWYLLWREKPNDPGGPSYFLWVFFPLLGFVLWAKWSALANSPRKTAQLLQRTSYLFAHEQRYCLMREGLWNLSEDIEVFIIWPAYVELREVERGLILVKKRSPFHTLIPRRCFREDNHFRAAVAQIRAWHAEAARL